MDFLLRIFAVKKDIERVSDGSCAEGVPERSGGMERKRNSGRSGPNEVRETSGEKKP